MVGIALIFAGFITLSIFGSQFIDVTAEADQFSNCFEYFEDRPPVPIDCDIKFQDKSLFFGLVVVLIGGGIISLIKGVRGKWDQDVKLEDMVGPGGGNTRAKKNDSDEKDSK
jgi:hypothetical protein